MPSEGGNLVSGFNPFDESYKERQRQLKIDFWQKVLTEIFIVPGGVLVFLFLAVKFGGGSDMLNFRSISGSAPIVISLFTGIALHCKYPVVYLDQYYIQKQKRLRKLQRA